MTGIVQADAQPQHAAHPIAPGPAAHAGNISQPSHVEQSRPAGVRRALTHIVAERPGRRLIGLARSVKRLTRLEGFGQLVAALQCPCGGQRPVQSEVRGA